MREHTEAPDILLLGPEWPIRALLRAQLLEDGYDVVAVDRWPVPRAYFQARAKPRAVILDLQGLPDPETVLDELCALAPPERVLVIAALGSVAPDDLRRRGFHVMTRPAAVADIAAAVARLL